MSVTTKNLEPQLELVTVTLTPEEYNPSIEKTLKNHARKANIPGFRVGHVPMSVVKKMYYKSTLAEETYRMASEELYKYIDDNKIDMIAEPMPEGMPNFDFENPSEIKFEFKIAVAPEIAIDVAKTSLEKVTITADEAMKKDYRENYMRRYAQLRDADEVTNDEAVMADFEQDGNVIAGNVYVGLISMSDAERKPFIGKKVGDTVKASINKLFKDEESRTRALKIGAEELAKLKATFNLTIKEIKGIGYPDLNEEFFKTAFPDGSVKDEKEFDKMLDDSLAKELERESSYYFTRTTRKQLIDNAAITLPESFLKEWILAINQEKFTAGQVEAEFPQYLEMLRWGLIQKKLALQADIKVSSEEIIDEAKNAARAQFAQYGLPDAADDMIDNYSKQILSNENEIRRINESIYDSKIMTWLEANAKIKNKKITVEQFKKLVEAL